MMRVLHGHWFRAALILAALTFQSLVAGTHIHLPVASQHQQQRQHDNDPADCAICQALVQTGHAILPAGPPLPVPVAASFIIFKAAQSDRAPAAAAHFWFSRGPPSI
jgi:hypothetical protein